MYAGLVYGSQMVDMYSSMTMTIESTLDCRNAFPQVSTDEAN